MQPLRAQEGTPPGSGPSGKEKGTSRGLFLPPNTPLSQSSGYVIFRTPGFKKLRISRLSQRRIKPNRALLRRRLATARVTHQSRHPCLSTTHPPSDARGCGRHSGAWGPLSSQSSASEGKSRERATDWGGGGTHPFVRLQLQEKLKGQGQGEGLYKGPEGREALHLEHKGAPFCCGWGWGVKREGSRGGRQGLSSGLGCRRVFRFEPKTEGQVARSRGAGRAPLPRLAVASPAGPGKCEH